MYVSRTDQVHNHPCHLLTSWQSALPNRKIHPLPLRTLLNSLLQNLILNPGTELPKVHKIFKKAQLDKESYLC